MRFKADDKALLAICDCEGAPAPGHAVRDITNERIAVLAVVGNYPCGLPVGCPCGKIVKLTREDIDGLRAAAKDAGKDVAP